jgi:hypothetical protein
MEEETMRKFLFLLSALAIAAFLAVGCAERGATDETGTETTGTTGTGTGTTGGTTGTTDTGTGTSGETTGTEPAPETTTPETTTPETTTPETTTPETTPPETTTPPGTTTPGTEPGTTTQPGTTTGEETMPGTTTAAGDTELRTSVETAMRDQGLDTTAYTITVAEGVVTISGSVPSQTEADRIVSIIRAVPNVKSVNNQLQVGGSQ